MGNRLKEEEKIERIIRGLLKLPENKRCINCNSLGPQYVCTTFMTYICTNCSGVHREFTHRVKSVSMAKFTQQEVSSLQAGGNERAREVYFNEFDPQYHTSPDGSDVNRLREFIRHVYVDRKYTGESSVPKLPKLRMSEDEPDERRNVGPYRGGSRSFRDDEKKTSRAYYSGSARSFRDEEWKVAVPYGGSRSFHDEEWKIAAPYGGSRSSRDHEDRYSRNYSQGFIPSARGDSAQNVVKYYYDERRSPRYQDTSRNGGFKKNHLRFEVVDNRIRDDRRARSGISTPKSQNRSPERKRNLDISSSHALPSQADGSAYNQKMKSASSSHDRKGSLETLIDFNAGPKPPNDRLKLQPQQTPPPNNDSNRAPFESPVTVKVPQAPKLGTLEALLLELSSPTSVPDITAAESPCNDADALSNVGTKNMPAGGVAPEAPPSTVCTNNAPAGNVAPAENMLSLFEPVGASTCTLTSTSVPFQPSNSDALQDVLGDTSARGTDAQQLPTTQQDQSSLSFAADSVSVSQQIVTPVVASSGLSRTSSFAPNTEGSLGVSADVPSQQSLLRTQSLPVVENCSKREELPLDLFAANYSSIPSHTSAWHPAPLHGMGYNMQYYPNFAPTPAFTGSRQPTNPFDISDDKSLVHSTHFPSMSSLEGALHNVSVPPTMMHTSGLSSYNSHFKPPQAPSHDSMVPSYWLPFPPSIYMGDQLHNHPQSLRPHGISGFSGNEAAATFSTLSTDQQQFQHPSIRYPAPGNLENFSSMGGNPFG